MTDEQIDALWLYRANLHDGQIMPQLRDFAHAILAAAQVPPVQPAGRNNNGDRLRKPDGSIVAIDQHGNESPLPGQPVPQAVAAPGWIAVSDRMPEPETDCIVWKTSSYITTGPYAALDRWGEQHECPVSFSTVSVPIGIGWDESDFEEVTHWMPLPAAPGAASPGAEPERADAEVKRELVHDALAKELGVVYDCTRVWEAWSIGTMSQDDFEPVTDRLDEIVDAILVALSESQAADAGGDILTAAAVEALAHSAYEEARCFGLTVDVFRRCFKSIVSRAAIDAARQAGQQEGAASPVPVPVVTVPMLTRFEVIDAVCSGGRDDQYQETIQRATIAKVQAALTAAGVAVRVEAGQ